MKRIALVLLAASLAACVVVPSYEPDPRSPKTTAVCHKGKKTLVLPEEAIQAHLSHGDTYGPCR